MFNPNEAKHGNIKVLAISDRFVAENSSVWEVWEEKDSDRLYRLLLFGNKERDEE